MHSDSTSSSHSVPICPKCREYGWTWNLPPLNWKDKSQNERYCLFHAPVDEKYQITDFNFRLQMYIEEQHEDGHDLILSGIVFPHRVRLADLLNGACHTVDVDLTECIFAGIVDCSKFNYAHALRFDSSAFWEEVDFQDMRLEGQLSLNSVEFKNDVFFNRSHFSNEILIENTNFKKRVFVEDANLKGIKFIDSLTSNIVSFNGARVGSIDIVRSKTCGYISFTNVIFDRINMNDNLFNEDIDFIKVKSSGKFNFENNICNGGVYLQDISIDGVSSFNRTKFKDYVSFRSAQFAGSVSFDGVHAAESVYLGKVQFNSGASFEALTANRTIQVSMVDMTNVSIKDAQLESFRFTHCRWEKVNGHSVVCGHSSSSPEELVDIYRRLKKNAKLDHDELNASEWHWQEKEMVYRSGKTSKFLWIVLLIYRCVSGYGEDPFRALKWLLFFIILPAIIFGCLMLLHTGFSSIIDWKSVYAVGNDWYCSFPLTKVTLSNVPGVGKRVLYLLFQIIIMLQASLFAFALRNKLRR